MNINEIEIYGRTLPVYFAMGYINAFMVAMGKSNVMSYYQAISHEIDPGKSLAGAKPWLDPLYCYFGMGSGKPQPLDYFFLTFLQAGLSKNTPPKERVVPGVTKRVGKIWWFGDAPISTYQDRQSLQYVFVPNIKVKLDIYKFGAPDIDHLSVKSSAELAHMGVQTFAEELSKLSGIECQVQIRNSNFQLEVVINECPFCLNKSTLCHVFVGVIEGLLEWMHGTHQPNAISTRMMINEQITTSHSIILDLK